MEWRMARSVFELWNEVQNYIATDLANQNRLLRTFPLQMQGEKIMEHFESADQLMKERSDDEKELLRTRKRETLSQKISRFLGGEMSADESDSFSRDHSSEIDQEIRRRESEADRKKAQDSENAKIFWAGGGTRDETYQAHVELERFLRSHSELQAETPENVRNGRMLHDWLATEKLSCTVANLERG